MSISSGFNQVIDPMLEVFQKMDRDTSISEYQYIQKYNLDGSNIQNVSKPIYTLIVNDRNEWKHMSNAVVEVRYQLTKADGTTALDTIDPIALTNLGSSLFKRVDFHVDGKLVESNEYPGEMDLIHSLAEYSTATEKHFSNKGYFPDRSDNKIYKSDKYQWFNATTKVKITLLNGAGAAGGLHNISATPALAVNDMVTVLINNFPATFKVTRANRSYFASALYSVAGVSIGGYIRLSDGVADPFANNDIIEIFADSKCTNQIIFRATTLALGSDVSTFTVAGGVLQYLTGAADGVVSTIATSGDNITGYLDDGFKQRHDLVFNNSTGKHDKVACCYIPLRDLFSFFYYNRVINKGSDFKFEFYKNDVQRALFGASLNPLNSLPDNYASFKYMSLSMWIPYVIPKSSIALELESMLASGVEKAMGFNQYRYFEYSNTIAIGQQSSVQWNITSDNSKPLRVFVYFKDVNHQSNFNINSQKFEVPYVSTAYVTINSNVVYPKEHFLINFNDTNTQGDGVQRIYHEFLRIGKRENSVCEGVAISKEEFRTLYPILAFDLTSQDSEKIYEYTGTNSIGIKLTFSDPQVKNLKMYAIVQFERTATMKGLPNKIEYLTN